LKKFKFEIKEMLEDGTFTGVASMYGNLDLGGDIVEKGAFTKTLQEKTTVPILWCHKTDMPIGIGELQDTESGLIINGKLNLEVEKAKEAYALIKQGAIKGLSIGYDVVKQKYEKGVRLLKELKLWEVSIVTFPMNTESTIIAVKEDESIEKNSDDENSTIEEVVDIIKENKEDEKDCIKKPKNTKYSDVIQQCISMLNTMLQDDGEDVASESVIDNSKSTESLSEEVDIEQINNIFNEMKMFFNNKED